MSVSVDDYDQEFSRSSKGEHHGDAGAGEMTVMEAFDVVMGSWRDRSDEDLHRAESILEADRAAEATCKELVEEIAALKRSRMAKGVSESQLEARAEAQQAIQETGSFAETATRLVGLRDKLKTLRA